MTREMWNSPDARTFLGVVQGLAFVDGGPKGLLKNRDIITISHEGETVNRQCGEYQNIDRRRGPDACGAQAFPL
jgi:hypothetical protein